MQTVLGLHHVTAIAGDPQRNLDFYSRVLGLRLVKRTVNFDDPSTHHFYFGDARGTPGSLITFFPWPGTEGGRPGAGQVNFTAFAIAPSSLGFWIERLIARGVAFTGPTTRFDERVLSLRDGDGMNLELVASAGAERRPGFEHAGIPAEHAIRGLHAATLWVNDAAPTAGVLAALGFRRVAAEENTQRFEAGEGGPGTFVDLRGAGDFWKGALGVGVVHHVAFRVANDASEAELAEAARRAGLSTTPPQDRVYFHSVYFREPGGVLFELATDGPGFTVDEPIDALGAALQLPPWLEPQRARLEAALPPVHAPVHPPERATFGAERA